MLSNLHDVSVAFLLFFVFCYVHRHVLRSFPTRRSSDLVRAAAYPQDQPRGTGGTELRRGLHGAKGDRKSTRLNSSHVAISYAVFCLKKKCPNKFNLYLCSVSTFRLSVRLSLLYYHTHCL